MKITRSNYESYFLDFLEGNLDPSLTEKFQLFLKENPDLASELNLEDIITLKTNQDIRFEAKEELKKPVSDQEITFQERAIAYYEGDLSMIEQKNFEASLSENSADSTESQQFGKLKLEADKTIFYKNKDQLKKRGILIPLWIKVIAVAAILLLAYLLFPPLDITQPENGKLADNFKSKNPKNIVLPDVKGKELQQEAVKTAPVVTPKTIPTVVPAKQKLTPADQKTGKKVVPANQLRIPATAPSLLQPRGIYFGQPEDVELAIMTQKDPLLISRELELSELLKVQLAAMGRSGDREFLSTEHLGLSGLHLVARLSGKRLTARKDDDGIVKSVSYNSRLLAFSIPVNR